MVFHTKESVSPLIVHGRDIIFTDSYAKIRKILIIVKVKRNINKKLKKKKKKSLQNITKQQPTPLSHIFIACYYV